MSKKPLEAIEEHYSKVTDPRKDRTKEHKLIGIIMIAICAVIYGLLSYTFTFTNQATIYRVWSGFSLTGSL